MNAQIIKIRSLSQKVINIFHPTSFFFQKIAREVLEESCREEIDFWKFFFKILGPTEQVAF